jgi:uncharacterized protein (DUF1499 family)
MKMPRTFLVILCSVEWNDPGPESKGGISPAECLCPCPKSDGCISTQDQTRILRFREHPIPMARTQPSNRYVGVILYKAPNFAQVFGDLVGHTVIKR